uniref:Uncharacterized protein n=1 Tax=Romanomermis culicivorax TaxID=13658 RepID=A0A915KAY3_ROMCU
MSSKWVEPNLFNSIYIFEATICSLYFPKAISAENFLYRSSRKKIKSTTGTNYLLDNLSKTFSSKSNNFILSDNSLFSHLYNNAINIDVKTADKMVADATNVNPTITQICKVDEFCQQNTNFNFSVGLTTTALYFRQV